MLTTVQYVYLTSVDMVPYPSCSVVLAHAAQLFLPKLLSCSNSRCSAGLTHAAQLFLPRLLSCSYHRLLSCSYPGYSAVPTQAAQLFLPSSAVLTQAAQLFPPKLLSSVNHSAQPFLPRILGCSHSGCSDVSNRLAQLFLPSSAVPTQAAQLFLPKLLSSSNSLSSTVPTQAARLFLPCAARLFPLRLISCIQQACSAFPT
jgi:hypothetical protein